LRIEKKVWFGNLKQRALKRHNSRREEKIRNNLRERGFGFVLDSSLSG
jgi:hypothetical protein